MNNYRLLFVLGQNPDPVTTINNRQSSCLRSNQKAFASWGMTIPVITPHSRMLQYTGVLPNIQNLSGNKKEPIKEV
jgi:hypothetical protein